MFRAIFAHHQERETEIFTAYGILSHASDDGQKIARNMLS